MTSKATNKFSPEVRVPRGADGAGSRATEHWFAVGDGRVDRGQDRLHGADAERVVKKAERDSGKAGLASASSPAGAVAASGSGRPARADPRRPLRQVRGRRSCGGCRGSAGPAGAQEAHLPVVALELLGVGIAPRHHRRPLGDADGRIAAVARRDGGPGD